MSKRKKEQKPEPVYTEIKPHLHRGAMTDEEEKALKQERLAYQAAHPKPWYL